MQSKDIIVQNVAKVFLSIMTSKKAHSARAGDQKMKSKIKIRAELQRVKRTYEEILVKGFLFEADQLKQRGLALCWVLDKYWGDVVLE